MSRRIRKPPHRSVEGPWAIAKRSLDVAVSATLLVGLAPLMAAIGAVVGLTSAGPVFYRQRRLGLNGRTFEILKFRTMVADAEPHGHAVWADDEDPRATRAGAVLRRYGIDELPQLWNVLRGDMSLVGPRPERPEFAREFTRRWSRFPDRLELRPGITGLAQVAGLRGNTHVGRRLERDLQYAAQWSFGGDLAILARTIPSLVGRRRGHGPASLGEAVGVARSSDGD